MIRARKVMSTACVSTRGNEAVRERGFTLFIIGPQEGVGQCTHVKFSVQIDDWLLQAINHE